MTILDLEVFFHVTVTELKAIGIEMTPILEHIYLNFGLPFFGGLNRRQRRLKKIKIFSPSVNI